MINDAATRSHAGNFNCRKLGLLQLLRDTRQLREKHFGIFESAIDHIACDSFVKRVPGGGKNTASLV